MNTVDEVSRGDTVEFTLKNDGKATGKVTSAYLAAGDRPFVSITSGGKRFTRPAGSVTVTRKGAAPEGRGIGDHAGRPAPNAGRKFPAEVLTPDEVDVILAQCSQRSVTGIRNRALLMLLYRSGLRASEVVALRPSDVTMGSRSIRVLDTKTGTAQTRGFHPSAADALSRWLDARRGLGLRNGRLFCTLKGAQGKPLTQEYLRALLHRLATEAGIEKRVTPHGLRHTYAAELQAAGTPVITISKLLGHSSVAVTNTYLQHLTNREAVAALEDIDLPELASMATEAEEEEPVSLEDQVAELRKQVRALTAALSERPGT